METTEYRVDILLLFLAFSEIECVVFAVSPDIELVKLPVPAPSFVRLSEVVGCGMVLQHTPRAVTVAPPSDETSPSTWAEALVTLLTLMVLTVGGSGVLKLISFP